MGSDEASIDLTQHIQDKLLSSLENASDIQQARANMGVSEVIGELIGEIRQKVFDATGLTVSAGVATNFMLAKIASGMNKPNGQTILDYKPMP